MIKSNKPQSRPLVSVIVPTRNSAATLKACLASIKDQTYPKIELIVVDRGSKDATRRITKAFTPHLYNHGPERSAQRNLGAARATGEYLLFIDSDMELSQEVVNSCVKLVAKYPKLVAVTIPETSFGKGFWAKCKALERTYYVGIDWVESPRFMSPDLFRRAGGYNTKIAGGEDWELTQLLRAVGPFGRVAQYIHHNEGRVTLRSLLRKRFYYYGEGWYRKGQFNHYADGPRLLVLFFSKPLRALRHPILWCGMMVMRTSELGARTAGLFVAKRNQGKVSNHR